TLAEPDGRTPKHWEPWETPRVEFLGWKIRVFSTIGFNAGDSVMVGQGLPTAETRTVGGVIGDCIYLTTQLDNDHAAGETVYNNTTLASTTLLDPVKLYKPVGFAPVYPSNWADTAVEVAEFPLVLTTFRQTEHWHSGQMTRNLPWLSELVPKPIIQINSVDAADYGIVSGDNVGIMSMRTAVKTSLTVAAVAGTNILTVASTTGFAAGDEILINAGQPNQEKKTIAPGGVGVNTLTLTTNLAFNHAVGESVLDLDQGLVGPFVAEVGTGLQSNQRVGKGTVAIPLHWAEKGANASTAVTNKLTINALDANAKMPETKACLCRIKKL
ncbi:MAG: molybdopterin dinucleotide binding domain-containing protein, partial [Actinomycetota bacterium]